MPATRCRRLASWLSLPCLGVSAPASAQIYSWRDPNGNLVLSDTQQPPAGRLRSTYAVPPGRRASGPRPTCRPIVQTYDELIVEHAQLNGVRPDLVRAVVQAESAFNPRATSPKGAMGLMQLMPATAAGSASAIPTTRARTSAAASPTCGSFSTATTTTRNWRWPPTMPARARSRSTARRCRPTARRRTTWSESTRSPVSKHVESPGAKIYQAIRDRRWPRSRLLHRPEAPSGAS